jgi:transglutaminase-like putative cysteine protease
MRIRIGCEFEYASDAPLPLFMLVQARPDGDHTTLYQSRWSEPAVPIREYIDSFGNQCWRLIAPAGQFRLRYDAVVAMSDEPDPLVPDAPVIAVESLPDATLVYLLPSRYIQSDLLVPISWELFGNTPTTWARVQSICDWVHANVAYEAGSSDPTVSAMDVYQRRTGVCRDFALLATGLCRGINIPARYTFGYLPDIGVEPPETPMDFHAWFEAYLGDRWYTFDARHNVPRIGRIVIGRGRDAVDVAMATQYGSSTLNIMNVWAEEVLGDRRTSDDADELEAADTGRWRSSQ